MTSATKAALKNASKAILRSITPLAISGIVYVVTHLGFHISTNVAASAAGILGTVLIVGVHYLEIKWPKLGVLLGWIGAPTYSSKATKAQLEAQILALEAQLNSDTGPAPGTPVAITLTPND